MPEPLWRLEGLRMRGRHRSRLQIEALDIPLGIGAVLGPSGAGKTSLLNLLAGFERAEGRLVGPACVEPGRLPLFWMPADGALWPGLRVADQLRYALPAARRGDADSIDALLRLVALEEHGDVAVEQLSAGMRSRVALARAIASEAQVLILDEPLAHVDPALAAPLWSRVVQRLRESRSSLLYASHAPEQVLGYAEHAICLIDGELRYAGALESLYRDPPDAALGALLGPVDQPDSAVRVHWRLPAEPAMLRPEQLALEASAGGHEVLSSHFHGSYCASELAHCEDGARRRFLHRGPALRVGSRVALALLSLALLVALGGCGAAKSQEPQLHFADNRAWMLPSAGQRLPAPRAVAPCRDGGCVVLDDIGRVLRYDAELELHAQWWMPEHAVGRPERVLELRDGRIVVADTHYHRVLFFSAEGELVDSWGEHGEGPGAFIYPVALAEDPDGNLYVAEYGGNDRVQKFAPDGSLLAQFGGFGAEPGQFQRPGGMCWHAGRIVIADAFNNRIEVFADDGRFIEVLGGSELAWDFPYDLQLGTDGDLWVVEYGAARVSRLSLNGELHGRYGAAGSDVGDFGTPWALAQLANGRVLVADTGNRRMVTLSP